MSDTPIFDENIDKAAEREKAERYSETPTIDETGTGGTPQPKVVAATVGAGVGSALATIIVWVVNASTGVEVPEAVELASGVVLTAALAFVGGYWKRG